MRIGERYGRGFSTDEHVDELTPQDMILENQDAGAIDDDQLVPTVRNGRAPGSGTPAAKPPRTLIPPPSQVGGDEALDFATLLREPIELPAFRSMDFDETPMPTAADTIGSVSPVAMSAEDEDDWIEEQLRHSVHHRARWPYALAAVGAVGIALVALAGWQPSWKQATSAAALPPPPLAAAMLPVAAPVYRAEDFPVVKDSEDPEVVYREIQQQLDQEAREAAIEKDRKAEKEAREARKAEESNEPYAATGETTGDKQDSVATTAGATDSPAEAQPAAAELPPFDKDAANIALANAAATASGCHDEGVPGGQVVRVAVTFAPSGRVNSAQLTEGSLLGTPTGSCVARAFYSARVNPFSGPTVTVHKTVSLQ